MASEWKECLLGDLVELKRGYDLPKKNRVEGSVPVISSSGTSDYHAESKVPGPGVVTGRYGTLGEVFYTEDDYWPLNTTLYVKDFKGNDPKFIYYFLKTIPYHLYSDKAAVPGVNRNHLHLASVKAPTCRNEQKRLGQLLSEFDDKIQLNRQTNQTLEKMAQALFKSWFVDFDPVIDNALAAGNTIPEPLQQRAEQRRALRASFERQGSLSQDQPAPLPEAIRQLFPASFVFDAEMEWIPEGWEVGSLDRLIKLTGGGTPKTSVEEYWNGNIPWFSVVDAPNDTDVFVIDTEKHVTQQGIDNSSTKLLRVGTTIISARGTVGKCAMVANPMTMNQSCYAVNGAEGVSDEFVYYLLRYQVSDLQQRSHGSVFSTITRDTFKSISMPFSGEELTQRFSEVVIPFFNKILANSKNVAELAKLRDTLLPKLISGELRIPEAQQQTEAAVA